VPGKIEVVADDGNDNRATETPEPLQAAPASPPAAATAADPSEKKPVHWGSFVRTASQQDIKDRLSKEISEILTLLGFGRTCCLALFEPENSIDSYDLDKIFNALTETNPKKDKDVVLFLLSRGGDAEPAYQISKLCKSFAHSKFTAVIPRHAKSAATLIAIGADEIHMGPLGQLGPIDPQIGGLPALGVSQALKTIASVAQQYPGSADMLARYLRMVLTVEQIGYCDRISESTAQYAERLLSTKPHLIARAPAVAKELVHEYKDHGFVIDLDEAKEHLGDTWIKTGTTELQAAEAIYSLFEMINFFLGVGQSKHLVISGGASLASSVLILETKKE
jgi:serine dehydrogenase proteinase